LRLSSAERLAKELKPAFIYVFMVNESPHSVDFVNAYLIHILDDNLARILKRLRKEHADGCLRINKKWISFSPNTAGQRLSPIGEALCGAVKTICAPNLREYSLKKADQLESLGFNLHRYDIKTQLAPMNPTELVDVFLGLKKAEISSVESLETRFDIKIAMPEPRLSKGMLQVSPQEADRCKIIVQRDRVFPPAVFEASVFFPPIPNLPANQCKCLIKSEFFQIILEQSSFKFELPPFKELLSGIEEWQNLVRMLISFHKGNCSIIMSSAKLPQELTIPVTFKPNGNSKISEWDINSLEFLLEALRGLDKVFKLSGAAVQKVTLIEIERVVDKLVIANRLFSESPKLPPLNFYTEGPTGTALPEKFDTIYVSLIPIEETTLAYYAVAEVITEKGADAIVLRFHSVSPRGIRAIRQSPDDYYSFIEKAKKETSIASVISMESQEQEKQE
jgi:hypothetical protein